MENIFETDTVKSVKELPPVFDWSEDYTKLNFKEESKLLSKELIKNSLIIENDKLLLAGEPIKIKISKNGFIYFMLDNNYITGSLRQEIMNLLFQTYRTNEVIKGGKYEFISLVKNNKKMIAWFNINNKIIEFISTVNKANETLEQISFYSFRDEPDSKPLVLRANESNSEIYGNSESSLGWLYTNDLIDRLSIAKEIIEEALCSTEPEVKEILEEIKDSLED